MNKTKYLLYGITVMENGKIANFAGHIFHPVSNSRAFYDGKLGKAANFRMVADAIIGYQDSLRVSPDELIGDIIPGMEKPKRSLIIHICAHCGKELSDKEHAYCLRNNIQPAICYQCQHQKK